MRYKFTQADSRKGGLTTVEKHGKTHMAEIGRVGFQTTVDRHWQGNRVAYREHLKERGMIQTCDRESVAMLDLYRQYRPDLFQ